MTSEPQKERAARYVAVLRDLGVDESPHTGRSLMDHLVGTYDLLESWGRPQRVCVAGLFHSIYGTQSYPIESTPLSRRDRIRAEIGEEAELLAYLFCVSQRGAFFDQLGQSHPELFDTAAGRWREISPVVLCDLVEIELANYVEFLPRTSLGRDEVRAFRARVEAAKAHVARPAYAAAMAALQHFRSGGPA